MAAAPTEPPGRPDAAAPVLFVASTATHVDTFAPVIAALGRRGVPGAVFTLDRWYGYGAWDAARQRGLAIVEQSRPAPPTFPFYRRRTNLIWRDVWAARIPLRRLLEATAPRAIVVGNDSGLIEKLVLSIATDRGWRRVLIQDGRLADRPASVGLAARLRRSARGLASATLRGIGLPYLAASTYGSGAVDVVAASGPSGAELITRRARPRVRIEVTGQPRYDHILAGTGSEPDATAVALFTTPFELDGYGGHRQQMQYEMATGLAQALVARGRRLVVKAHPREDTVGYQAVVVAGGSIWASDAASLLTDAAVSIIGLSTLVEEATLVGRPVLVPGEFVHSGPLAALLPDPAVYPRFESVAECMGMVELFADGPARANLLARQRSALAQQLFVDPDWPAAERVADLVLDR